MLSARYLDIHNSCVCICFVVVCVSMCITYERRGCRRDAPLCVRSKPQKVPVPALLDRHETALFCGQRTLFHLLLLLFLLSHPLFSPSPYWFDGLLCVALWLCKTARMSRIYAVCSLDYSDLLCERKCAHTLLNVARSSLVMLLLLFGENISQNKKNPFCISPEYNIVDFSQA